MIVIDKLMFDRLQELRDRTIILEAAIAKCTNEFEHGSLNKADYQGHLIAFDFIREQLMDQYNDLEKEAQEAGFI
jgi:hypothetical protein